jgi:DNA polymerase-3 subunit delta'
LLDKNGALTDEERCIIETHPTKGREVMLKIGAFGPEVVDIVTSHHEFLDGSGYPNRISGSEISDIIRHAARSPVEGAAQVLILDEFHLLESQAAARLLKTIEEPPAATIFIVLADFLGPDLVTVASRCVRIDFSAIDETAIAAVLTAEGSDPAVAGAAAKSAAGNLDRARVLVSDPGLARRRDAFAAIARRIDGTGAAAATAADEMTKLANEAADILTPIHDAEIAELDARVAAAGERGSGRKTLEERHKREVRRYRTDELRSGLAVMAGEYRDAVVAGVGNHPEIFMHAVNRIHASLESLERNPNEALLLQALLLDLPSL